ncbi:hypothetical protein [Hoylesella enoeca]|uniref:hypothetical protein n=1 Tax=Hoylesella enoeca TaxID=76123 RepID=UPI00288C2038|nr:hypothetical protein [Hoylesella enoeca]
MNKTKLIFAAALLFTASCANEDVNKDNGNPNNQGMTTFVSGDEPATRTSMDHTAGGKGKFFWTTGDNIWIDNAGTPESNTSSSITGKTDYAKFYFASTLTGTSYPVTYTGKSSTKSNEVTIAASQTQSAPNNTDHFANSGDCGTATATGSSNEFTFKLKHQAAYLCILPRNENTELGGNLYLQKIVITSNNNIAGIYTLSSSGLTLKSGGSNTITLTTGSGNGFSMSNATTNTNNSVYMVIAPGTHTLTIDCYVKDPITEVGATLTQTVSTTFAANTITDITADVTPTRTNYPGNGYYMWDAAVGQHYWAGYEWDNPVESQRQQPTINGTENSAYAPDGFPESATNPRGYRDDVVLGAPANRSAANCPNINECLWYVIHGEPHWDNTTLWTTMGHLYVGGMWLKRKAGITGYNVNNSPNGTDYRNIDFYYQNENIITGKPSNQSDFFYLPALGCYNLNKTLTSVGERGLYWMSSPSPSNRTYARNIAFTSTFMGVYAGGRNYGNHLWTAQ